MRDLTLLQDYSRFLRYKKQIKFYNRKLYH